jgi:ribosomal-protein-alanine N-acetyltransferase
VASGAVLETERLVLSSMSAADLEGLLALFGDPEVMAAFDDKAFTREQVCRWLERDLDHQREHGYGLFAVRLKGSDRLIGDCGLERMEVRGEYVAELGYDFRSGFWNRGYATEAAGAVRDYAFETLRLPVLVSLIRPRNPASVRVAEKTGLRMVDEIQRHDRTYLLYEIENPLPV